MAPEIMPFLERMLLLLGQGNFTTTYKYAVLLALVDLCVEGAGRGVPPSTVTTRQVAEKVVETYWPHTATFDGKVLTQGTNRHPGRSERSQAGILSILVKLREEVHPDDSSAFRARRKRRDRYQQAVREVEWILIKQPIPRLQVIGSYEDRFLYEIDWKVEGRSGSPTLVDGSRTLKAGEVGDPAFDNRLRLKEGVAESLIQLAPVLRPLIHRQWAAMVAKINEHEDSRLEEHLFGRERAALADVRPGLWDLQKGRCFYCEKAAKLEATQVDHFLPWSRHPDDSLGNLVLADAGCNQKKTDFLADIGHALRWEARASEELEEVATAANWPFEPSKSWSSALMVYGHLSPGVRLWRSGRELVEPEGVGELTARLRGRLVG